jgi:hypothetical protein
MNNNKSSFSRGSRGPKPTFRPAPTADAFSFAKQFVLQHRAVLLIHQIEEDHHIVTHHEVAHRTADQRLHTDHHDLLDLLDLHLTHHRQLVLVAHHDLIVGLHTVVHRLHMVVLEVVSQLAIQHDHQLHLHTALHHHEVDIVLEAHHTEVVVEVTQATEEDIHQEVHLTAEVVVATQAVLLMEAVVADLVEDEVSVVDVEVHEEVVVVNTLM